MSIKNLDYNRLIYLNQRINQNSATQVEKDEYMLILYQNGNITKNQYDNYLNSKNAQQEEVVKAAMTIGGIVLVGYLLSKLFSK